MGNIFSFGIQASVPGKEEEEKEQELGGIIPLRAVHGNLREKMCGNSLVICHLCPLLFHLLYCLRHLLRLNRHPSKLRLFYSA